jgi:hypothetical protein
MMPRVDRIVLHQTLVGDLFLDGLRSHEQLRNLSLNAPRVSGAALQKLASLPNLRSLSLEDMQISDADIPHLAKLQQLKNLSLCDTRISREGAERLRQALPNCQVEYRPDWQRADANTKLHTD